MKATKNSTCRYCGSTQLMMFLSLGDQPPSNSFISSDQIATEEWYPLDVYFCEICYLVQLLDVVPKEIIFDEYLYLSSSSKALKKHYADLAQDVTKRFVLKAHDVVVDIGCNDGILLCGYRSDLIRVGVEPSQVADVAIENGFAVEKDFFNQATSQKIVKKYGKAKIVTATNVFAHVDEIGKFVEGLPILLDDEGVFIIEAPYLLDLIDQVLFDTIYHEHLCYVSLTPLIPFLKKYKLDVFAIERIPFGASGPAIRVFIQKETATRPIETSVNLRLKDEKKWGIEKKNKYLGYAEKIKKVKNQVRLMMKRITSSGATFGGYGAPAKGNTLLNYFGMTPKEMLCIAETNPVKQGLITPGSHIPIVSEETFLERMPAYSLLLAWNYLDFFLEKSEYIKKGGKFLVPLPKPQILP